MASVESNGVHYMTILQSLHNLVHAFSQKLAEEAEQTVGKDPKKQEAYLDMLTKTHWINPRKGYNQDINLN